MVTKEQKSTKTGRVRAPLEMDDGEYLERNMLTFNRKKDYVTIDNCLSKHASAAIGLFHTTTEVDDVENGTSRQNHCNF